MAKPNYQYEKRQKELAKKRKQQEKQKRKSGKQEGEAPPGGNGSPTNLA